MEKFIKHFIEIIIYKPKTVLLLLALVTVFLAGGLPKLVLDPSTEYLMPKDDPVYKLGERAKLVFADSKTFMITALRPTKGHELFSSEVFEQMGEMVKEIEEYHHFNVKQENARLQTILQLSNVSVQKPKEEQASVADDSPTADETASADETVASEPAASEPASIEENDLEKQLDSAILGGDVSANDSPAADETVASEPAVSEESDLEKQLDAAILGGDVSANDSPAADETVASEPAASEESDLEKQLDSAILGGDVSASDSPATDETVASEPATSEENDLEKQLDSAILGGDVSASDSSATDETAADDNSLDDIISQRSYEEDNIWDINTPLPTDRRTKATRERNVYNYENYQPVTLNQIKSGLDEIASMQMETILFNKKMQDIDYDQPLSEQEFKKFLEAWEDIYLFKSMMVLKIFNNPLSGEDIKGTADELLSVDFVEQDTDGNFLYPKTQAEFQQYQEKLMLNPLNKGMLFSKDKDGNIEALAFNLIFRHLDSYETLSEYFWSIFSKHNKEPLKIYTNGTIVFEKFINDYIARDLKLFVPLVFLVVVLTFYFNFGSIRGVVLPSLAVLLGMIWTMGTMGYFGIRISILVSILPPLLLAIGSSYSIHVFNQYMKNLKTIRGADKKEELKKSMLHIFPTVFLVALTTIVSFLTLAPSQVASLREFGTFAAVGSFYSSVIAFILLPSALSLLTELPYEKFYADDNRLKKNFVERIVEAMAELSINHSKGIVIIFNVIILASFFGIMQIKIETTPMVNFKESSYIRQSDAYLGNHFDGTFLINLVIDSGKDGGVKDLEFLKMLEKIRTWTEQPEQKEKYMILHYNSFSDFIKRMNMAMNADNVADFKLPDDPRSPTNYIEIFAGEDIDSDGRPDVFEQFVDAEYRRANIAIRTGAFNGQLMTTSSNEIIQQKVLEYLDTLENPNGYKWFFVGDAPNFVHLADYISESQLKSIFFSLVILVLLIFFLFRSFLAGMIGIVPIVTGISLIYGFMGYFNIPLDIPKVILSGVAIGIGIDDTIHYVKTLTHNVQRTESLEDAIRLTHRESGLAIVYTSVALVFGFSVLIWSNFVPVYSLGYLVASVMLATTLGALLILPALIHFFNLNLKGESFLDDF